LFVFKVIFYFSKECPHAEKSIFIDHTPEQR